MSAEGSGTEQQQCLVTHGFVRCFLPGSKNVQFPIICSGKGREVTDNAKQGTVPMLMPFVCGFRMSFSQYVIKVPVIPFRKGGWSYSCVNPFLRSVLIIYPASQTLSGLVQMPHTWQDSERFLCVSIGSGNRLLYPEHSNQDPWLFCVLSVVLSH